MDATVTWKGKLSFTGTAAGSGFSLPLDTTPDVGGEDQGFRPMELFALGLAGCTAMDVISILSKKRQEVSGFEVKVHLERAKEHPKVFTSAVIDYQVTGRAVSETALVRAIELSATRYCPAQAMLGQVMQIRQVYHLYEDGLNGGERVPVKSGEYTPVEEAASS
jgi:putative redox protein